MSEDARLVSTIKEQTKGISLALVSGRGIAPVEMIPNMMMQTWPANTTFNIQRIYGKDVDAGRINAAKNAVQLRSKFLWFVDDDTVPPPDAGRHLIYLLEQNGPPHGKVMAAAAVYTTRSSPPEPLVFREQGAGPDWDWKVGEVLKRWGAGTGCMVINTEVFQHLPEPWFKTISESSDRWSDDLYFCDLLAQAGFELMVHGGILCHHYDYEKGTIYQLPRNSYPFRHRINEPREPQLSPAPSLSDGTNMHQLDLVYNPWMTTTETIWLIDRAKSNESFVEVGCWTGVTTRNIARHAPKCKIYAIDHFQGSSEHIDPLSMHYEPRLKEPDWLLHECERNTQGLENVHILSATSIDAARDLKWNNLSFDTVFIDGSHEYEDVMRDIAAWLLLVKPGGVLCGHDMDWPGVLEAVTELLPGAIHVPGTSIWMYEVKKGKTDDSAGLARPDSADTRAY
jgi:predicted O-methyltransferase YrrM